MFAAMGAALWTSYLIINLHFHIVWKSDVLERHGVWIGVLLWCVPIGFTVYVLYMKKVAYTFGLDCLVTADVADNFFFYPLSVMVCEYFFLQFPVLCPFLARKGVAKLFFPIGRSVFLASHHNVCYFCAGGTQSSI